MCKTNQKLIIPFNRNNLRFSLIAAPLLILGCLFLLETSKFYKDYFYHYVILAIQNMLIFSIVLFLIMFFFGIFLLKNTKPAAILDGNGIWLIFFGYIPWSQISTIDTCFIMGMPIEVIAIQVKNFWFLFKQASIIGKIGLFWSKVFGTSHITISNIELSNKEILLLAQHFMDNR